MAKDLVQDNRRVSFADPAATEAELDEGSLDAALANLQQENERAQRENPIVTTHRVQLKWRTDAVPELQQQVLQSLTGEVQEPEYTGPTENCEEAGLPPWNATRERNKVLREQLLLAPQRQREQITSG